MTNETKENAKASALETYKKKIIELSILAIPTAFIKKITDAVLNNFGNAPSQALAILIPLGFLIWFSWRKLNSASQFRLSRPLFTFFCCYVLLFSIASECEFLSWDKSLTGYEDSKPRNFLSLNWAGDWRYSLIHRIPADPKIVIVSLNPEPNLSQRRRDIGMLIHLATLTGAKGVAFDFYFRENATMKEADQFLCRQLEDAEKKNIPILAGFRTAFDDDVPQLRPLPSDLSNCLSDKRLGHLIVYREWDNRVRMVPAHFAAQLDVQALSVKVAELLGTKGIPTNGLIQFVAPQQDFHERGFTDLMQMATDDRYGFLNRSFIFVRERSAKDMHETPFGTKPGVMIHAYAVHSLKNDQLIQRAPGWTSFVIILGCCYLLLVMQDRSWSIRQLLQFNCLASVVLLISSALLMRFFLLWLDIIYPLLAIWILFFLLLGSRRLRTKKVISVTGEQELNPS